MNQITCPKCGGCKEFVYPAQPLIMRDGRTNAPLEDAPIKLKRVACDRCNGRGWVPDGPDINGPYKAEVRIESILFDPASDEYKLLVKMGEWFSLKYGSRVNADMDADHTMVKVMFYMSKINISCHQKYSYQMVKILLNSEEMFEHMMKELNHSVEDLLNKEK